MIDDAYAAVLDRIPLYRRDKLVPPEDLHRSIAHSLRSIVTAIRHPQATLDLAAPQETGRRRAHQGVPLPGVLQCYRISFAALWDALVEESRRAARPATADALLAAASMIWQLTDEHALALTEAYRAATAELLLAQQRRRFVLVEALLTGHPGPETAPWEAAARQLGVVSCTPIGATPCRPYCAKSPAPARASARATLLDSLDAYLDHAGSAWLLKLSCRQPMLIHGVDVPPVVPGPMDASDLAVPLLAVAADEGSGASPASTSAWRSHLRTVSALIPRWPATALIAAHSVG